MTNLADFEGLKGYTWLISHPIAVVDPFKRPLPSYVLSTVRIIVLGGYFDVFMGWFLVWVEFEVRIGF